MGEIMATFGAQNKSFMAEIAVVSLRNFTSKKLRIGIFDFYITFSTILGSSFVESNYAAIVKHFFTEIVQGSRNQSSKYETLLVRKLVGTLLRDLIGARLLSEQGQTGVIRELSDTYLKEWPVLLSHQVAQDVPVLVIALKEVAGLIIQLGSAPSSDNSGPFLMRFLRRYIH